MRWLAPLPLLVFMAVLMARPAREWTVTIDEVAHIGAGLSYVQRLDLRLNGEHPPLAKVLAALPLVANRAKADYRSMPWTVSADFFPAYLAQWSFGEHVLGVWNPRQDSVALARLPMIGLTLALGLAVYGVGLRLGGSSGALLSLSVYASTPLFLTFGPLVLTDAAVTLFAILSLWAFARLHEHPSPFSVWAFAVAFAGALLSKFSAPALLIAILIFVRYDSPGERWWRTTSFRALLRAIGISALIVYLVYLVLSINQPVDMQHRIGQGSIAHAIGRALMPPWLYLRGLTMVAMTASRPVYLFGETHGSGLPVYFPLLMLWKSTPGFLGLIVLAAFLWPRASAMIPGTQRTLWRVLWISFVVLAGICLLSRLNVGLRHFAVPAALLTVLLAPLPAMVRNLQPRSRAVMGTLVVVFAASSVFTAVRAYPHFLPYTNALTFGIPAYRLFGDSNLDWNHALGDVRQFVQARRLSHVLVDTYGISDPRRDVPPAMLWNCQTPEAGDAGKWAVVSANALLEAHNCAWLLPHIREPLAGGSMYAAQLPSTIPPPGSAGGPPTPQQRKYLFSVPLDFRAMMIAIAEDPHKIRPAFEDLAARFAPSTIGDEIYPPKEPVQWPWSNK